MMMIRVILAALVLASPAFGKVPKVVADIPPVQSLVAIVMQGLGEPDLILRSEGSPHHGALRPSQARALQGADLVVWIGPDLTPWLEKPLATLASGADRLTLLQESKTELLQFVDGKETDPHAWLDPQNGQLWLSVIAEELARLDPDNAAIYRANAVAGQANLVALQSEIKAMLSPAQGRPYVTYHAAYQYFENRFGLKPVGSVTTGDATLPGPAELARLGTRMEKAGVTCALSEAQVDPGLLFAAAGRTDLRVIPLDPMGRNLAVGPGLYPALLHKMAASFSQCVNPQ